MPVPEITVNKHKAAADGVDVITISGVIEGASVTRYLMLPASEMLLDQRTGVTGTLIDYTFDTAGEYKVVVVTNGYNDGTDVYNSKIDIILLAE